MYEIPQRYGCGTIETMISIRSPEIQAAIKSIREKEVSRSHMRKTGALSMKKIQDTRASVFYKPEGRMYEAQRKWIKFCTGIESLSEASKKKLVKLAQKLDIPGITMQSTKSEMCDAINRYYTKSEDIPELSRGSPPQYEFYESLPLERKIHEFAKILEVNYGTFSLKKLCRVYGVKCSGLNTDEELSLAIAEHLSPELDDMSTMSEVHELYARTGADAEGRESVFGLPKRKKSRSRSRSPSPKRRSRYAF